MSIVVEVAPASEDRSPVYRAKGFDLSLVSTFKEDKITSPWGLFKRGKRLSKRGVCVGERDKHTDGSCGAYRWLTYQDVEVAALALGTELIRSNFVKLKKFDAEAYGPARSLRSIGIYSKNCKEFFILEQASNALGITMVPFYDSLSNEAIDHIIQQTMIDTMIIGPEQRSLCDRYPELNYIFTQRTEIPGQQVYQFWDLVSSGKVDTYEPIQIPLDHVGTICYTSGTTGVPKGVMVTYRMMLACAAAGIDGPMNAAGIDIAEEECHFSYLPVAHAFERIVTNVAFGKGACIGIYSGDVKKLIEDVKILRPTVFCGVPRVFNRIDARIMGEAAKLSPFKKWLFQRALAKKKANMHNSCKSSIYDLVVFRKIRNALGGRVRHMISGGAPLDAEVQVRIQSLMGAYIYEGYGSTETMGAAFINSSHTLGNVGAPMPAYEYCLMDIPDLNYYSKDKKGEVLIRGNGVSPGYFLAPGHTVSAWDVDAWYHTGDIGHQLPSGALRIIDRVSNICKLAQGEFVSPEQIEGVLSQASLALEVFVHADSLESFVVALVTLDMEQVVDWARARNIAADDTLKNNPEMERAIMTQFDELATKAKLKGYERVKLMTIVDPVFTTENNLITPTSKFKRPNVREWFAKELAHLIEKGK